MLTLAKKIPGLAGLVPKEPAAIIGVVYSVVVAVLYVLHVGVATEIVAIGGPILAALHIRTQVFSPDTVRTLVGQAKQSATQRATRGPRDPALNVGQDPPGAKPENISHRPKH